MKINKIWSQDRYFLFVFFVSILLFVSLHLNNRYLGLPAYSLEYFSAICVILLSISILGKYTNYTYFDLLFTGTFLLIVITCLYNQTGIHLEFLNHYLLFFLIYLWVRFTSLDIFQLNRIFTVVAFICIACELCIMLAQYLGWLTNINPLYSIGGANGHPTFTIHTLILFVPLLVYQIVEKKNSAWYRIIFIFLTIFIVGISVYFKARAALLSLLLISLVYALFKTRIFRKKWLFPLISGVFLTGSLVVLFFLKYKSSSSRLFIWKTSLKSLLDKPFEASGAGTFKNWYNQLQETYFRSNGDDVFNASIARYVETSYNDFLELWIENGFVTMLLLCIVLIWLLFSKRSRNEFPFYLMLVAAIPLMLTWTNLKYLGFSIPFSFAIGMLSRRQPKILIKQKIAAIFVPVFIVGILGTLLITTTIVRLGYTNYRKALVTQKTRYFEEADKQLYFNSRFLMDYADHLANKNKVKPALKIFERAQKWDHSPKLSIKTANLYKRLEQYKKVNAYYLQAYYIAPYHTYPKYLLAKNALNMKDCKTALKYQKLLEQDFKNRKVTADNLLIREELTYHIQSNCDR